MLVLRCTAKMLKRLGLTPKTVKVHPESDGISEWYVNTIDWLKGGRYAICVNARARYALLVLLEIVRTAEDLGEALTRTLFTHLIQMQVPAERIDGILAGFQEVIVAKTVSRSVLGTVNDMLENAYVLIDRCVKITGSFERREIENALNTMPQRPFGWGYAVEQMWQICTGNTDEAARKIHLGFLDTERSCLEAAEELVDDDLADKLDFIVSGMHDVLFSREELQQICNALSSLASRYRADGEEDQSKCFADLQQRISGVITRRFVEA